MGRQTGPKLWPKLHFYATVVWAGKHAVGQVWLDFQWFPWTSTEDVDVDSYSSRQSWLQHCQDAQNTVEHIIPTGATCLCHAFHVRKGSTEEVLDTMPAPALRKVLGLSGEFNVLSLEHGPQVSALPQAYDLHSSRSLSFSCKTGPLLCSFIAFFR